MNNDFVIYQSGWMKAVPEMFGNKDYMRQRKIRLINIFAIYPTNPTILYGMPTPCAMVNTSIITHQEYFKSVMLFSLDKLKAHKTDITMKSIVVTWREKNDSIAKAPAAVRATIHRKKFKTSHGGNGDEGKGAVIGDDEEKSPAHPEREV